MDSDVPEMPSYSLEGFEKAIWLDKLETIRDEAEHVPELAYILSVIHIALQYDQLPNLQEQFSSMLSEELEKTETRLNELQEELELSSIEKFLYNEEHDSHFPFGANSEIDTQI